MAELLHLYYILLKLKLEFNFQIYVTEECQRNPLFIEFYDILY